MDGDVAATGGVAAARAALSPRTNESVAIAVDPGTAFGVGKRIGVRTRTAAIKMTARTMRRDSMRREKKP
jgi:hypothetical protein